jgi:hypothetical protein
MRRRSNHIVKNKKHAYENGTNLRNKQPTLVSLILEVGVSEYKLLEYLNRSASPARDSKNL